MITALLAGSPSELNEIVPVTPVKKRVSARASRIRALFAEPARRIASASIYARSGFYHGFPFLRINLPYILAFDKNSLDALVNKTFNLIRFSIRLIGFRVTVQFVVKAIVERFQKKRVEASLKK